MNRNIKLLSYGGGMKYNIDYLYMQWEKEKWYSYVRIDYDTGLDC